MAATPAPIGKRGKPVKQDDTAVILWTSGTTGEAKGVELSHRNLTAALSGLNADRPETEKAAEVVVLCPLPLYHSYGFVSCLKSVATGEKVVLTEETELPEILKLVGEFGATQVSLPPPIVALMAKSCDDPHLTKMMDACDLATLKVVTSGGVPLGKSVVERFRSRFPKLVLSQGYGLTETCGVGFRPRGPVECDRFGSAGRLIANCEAKIVDPSSGLALPPCSHGELWIRGPTVMKGYIGDKQGSSSKALDSEGWLRTGDYCYIDSEGYLFVLDKLQDLIKYKDQMISPGQLEDVLSLHPDIIDAVVIPFKSEEEASEVPMALVVKRPESSIDELQIMSFVVKQVEEEYKKIRKVSFVDSIPRNPMGKASRKKLSKQFSS
ncbi:hypothetical protein Sjap_016435 [Stephania japonica]|uniref:4-coumarate--CoA ligase n=1 Tax=Stephania japonica TaxID=461633 RepID=A0AAP0NSD7_9MAGN